MGSIQKRTTDQGVRWKARYRAPDGRERARTFGRKLDAQRWLDTVEASKHRGDWVDPQSGRVTFGEWASRVESTRRRRPSTEVRDEMLMRLHVLPQFGHLGVGQIDTTSVEEWIASLSVAGLGADTVRKCYGLLRYSMAHAVRRRLIPSSPCTDDIVLPPLPQREMRFLSPDEVESLADAIDARWRPLVLMAAYTGLRFGELTALRPSRLDLLRRTVRVEEAITEVNGRLVAGPAKTRASRRTVSIPGSLVDELAMHLSRTGDSTFVFESPDGGPLRRTNWRRRFWVPAVVASVGDPMRFHDLRHTHAALLIAQGTHPKVVQERLGHASITVTLDTYGHLMDGMDAAAADRLDALRAGSLPNRSGAVVRITEARSSRIP